MKYKNKAIALAAVALLLGGAWFANESQAGKTYAANAQGASAIESHEPVEENNLRGSAEPAEEPLKAEPTAVPDIPVEPVPAPAAEPASEPEPEPEPVEPQAPAAVENNPTVTISISCAVILDNMHMLNPEKAELIPEDGIILPPSAVTLGEGESVFDVLLRETRANRIHMEFMKTPVYNSAYIEGIHNIYEFDCGPLSGWMYRVNGAFPNRGSSRYLLSDGDVIEWLFTCDLGRDIGGFGISQTDE
ncbi:MAG: DUF4430 domain-containing protein [Defluviitaleaceae bacterium]|nr:DUF4430 domain-containing protein [Defluviitaleaceae bacterium]